MSLTINWRRMIELNEKKFAIFRKALLHLKRYPRARTAMKNIDEDMDVGNISFLRFF